MDKSEDKPASVLPSSRERLAFFERDSELEWQVELGQEILEQYSKAFELLAK